ncbi:MAG: cation diffusion facilitator family transporter [Solirubrobacterales bacterium]
MRYPRGTELPPTQDQANRRAIRLEWFSLAYWITAIIAIYFTLGQSQAMKAAWIEDILALFPPIAFLVASRYRHREPSGLFPWGYHRAITVAYVIATMALFALGAFILVDSVDHLLRGTHPPIGLVEVFDTQIWAGWLMLAALAYSGIPPLILGRLKKPLSDTLHDKVLFADAKMNQADWMTASAAAVGVIGIGFGLWWADAVAAIVIGLDIVHDGYKFLRESVGDLMDESPKTHDEKEVHPLITDVKSEVQKTGWIDEAAVRLREQGHLIGGDVFVVPKDAKQLPDRTEELIARIHDLDWRLRDITVAVVRSLSDVPEDLLASRNEKGVRRDG